MSSIRATTLGRQCIDLLLGDVCLIDLHEPRQTWYQSCPRKQGPAACARQLLLDAEVEVLRVRRPQMLLRDREHRKSGGAKAFGQLANGKVVKKSGRRNGGLSITLPGCFR